MLWQDDIDDQGQVESDIISQEGVPSGAKSTPKDTGQTEPGNQADRSSRMKYATYVDSRRHHKLGHVTGQTQHHDHPGGKKGMPRRDSAMPAPYTDYCMMAPGMPPMPYPIGIPVPMMHMHPPHVTAVPVSCNDSRLVQAHHAAPVVCWPVHPPVSVGFALDHFKARGDVGPQTAEPEAPTTVNRFSQKVALNEVLPVERASYLAMQEQESVNQKSAQSECPGTAPIEDVRDERCEDDADVDTSETGTLHWLESSTTTCKRNITSPVAEILMSRRN